MLLEHPARLAEPAISSAVNLGRLVSGKAWKPISPFCWNACRSSDFLQFARVLLFSGDAAVAVERHYQCARYNASTVPIPEIIAPAVAIAADMPSGNSRLMTAATKIAATGSATTK
jgi:hypothetical protein